MKKIDDKQFFLGNDIELTKGVTLFNPTVKQIMDFGKERHWAIVCRLVASASNYKDVFQDMGIDYSQVSDFLMFCSICQHLKQDDTKLLFGKLDLSKLHPAQNTETNELVLWNPDNGIVINEETYSQMVYCLKKMYGLEEHDYTDDLDNPLLLEIYGRIDEFDALSISTLSDFIRRWVLR